MNPVSIRILRFVCSYDGFVTIDDVFQHIGTININDIEPALHEMDSIMEEMDLKSADSRLATDALFNEATSNNTLVDSTVMEYSQQIMDQLQRTRRILTVVNSVYLRVLEMIDNKYPMDRNKLPELHTLESLLNARVPESTTGNIKGKCKRAVKIRKAMFKKDNTYNNNTIDKDMDITVDGDDEELSINDGKSLIGMQDQIAE